MTAYNPIEAMNRLKAAGLPAKQAEALANEMHGVISQLVTKDDMGQSIASLKADLTATAWTVASIATGVILAALGVVVAVILSH